MGSVKLIRDKATGFPVGYGFLDFGNEAACERVLNTYNGQTIPGTVHTYRLNWGAGRRRAETAGGGESSVGYQNAGASQASTGSDHSIFVGDLAAEVDEGLLQTTFSVCFSSVTRAKVIRDPSTGVSKGFGFVHFKDSQEAEQALVTMNGVFVGSRAIRVNQAKKNAGTFNMYGAVPGYGAPADPAAAQAAYYAQQQQQYAMQQQQWAAYNAQQQQYAAYYAQQAAAATAAAAAPAPAPAKDPTAPIDINTENTEYIDTRLGSRLELSAMPLTSRGGTILIDPADYSQSPWERCM